MNLKRSQWRTVFVALTGMGAALIGLGICARWPAASASYPAFVGCIGACVAAVAFKATKEHQALEAK